MFFGQKLYSSIDPLVNELTVCELEHGPVEIVDLPIEHGRSVHINHHFPMGFPIIFP